MRIFTSFITVFILLFSVSFAISEDSKIDIYEGQTRVISIEDVYKIAVGDPEIADVTIFSERSNEILLNGKKAGITNLHIWNEKGDKEIFDVRVFSPKSMMQRKVYSLKHYSLKKTSYNDSLSQIEIKIEQDSVDNLRAILNPVLGEKNFTIDVDRNRVIMVGNEKDIETAELFLSEIDIPLRRIMIEAKVIEITKGDLKKLGNTLIAQKDRNNLNIDMSSDIAGFNYSFDTFTDLAERFNITFDTLRTIDVGRTLVNPQISVLDGKTAWILAGEKYPIASRDSEQGLVSYSYISTGIILAVTPRVGTNDEITLWLKPEVSKISGWVGDPDSSSDNAAPIIDTREVMSEIRVKDGESIIMGGLQREDEVITRSKVPVLGELPLVGSVFRKKRSSKETSELIIVITPHIIEENQTVDRETLSLMESYD